jgi:hypothetical protein
MKRSKVVVFLITSLLFVGCSFSQEKPSSVSASNIAAMNVAGTYTFENIITETDVYGEGLMKGQGMKHETKITQEGSVLTWSHISIGDELFRKKKAAINANIAEFVDIRFKWWNAQVKWNATIVFSENGFNGNGTFYVEGQKGKFKITGTRID